MSKREKQPYHRLLWMSAVGGFLDGTKVEFAPGLNCLIGGRGTGKTTLLEFMRYALGCMPDDQAACKRIQALMEKNLQSGRIELGIETKEGVRYVVTRTLNEPPMVLTENRKPTEIILSGDGLFPVDIFSQNGIETVADNPLAQLELVDSFAAEEIAAVNAELKRVALELETNAHAIEPLQTTITELQDQIAQLPGIVDQLGTLKATGDDAAAINQAHAAKALRDRQKRAVGALGQYLGEYDQTIAGLIGQLARQTNILVPPNTLAGPDKALMTEIQRSVLDCAREVDAALRKAQARITEERKRLPDEVAALTAAHAREELAFRALIEKHQAAIGQDAKRVELEKKRNELMVKENELKEAKAGLGQQQTERTGLLKSLTDLRHRRFQIRKRVTDSINQGLSPTIRISIVQDGNPARYLQLLESVLQGTKMRYATVAAKIVNAMWPTDLAALAKKRDFKGLADKADLHAPEQAEKVITALNVSDRLHELETVELLDAPKIELKDGEYKDSTALSTGQKCTTILPILLLESQKPLLVDQPEDNLDNRFIWETVVENLKKMKAQRQFIFVTHSPNIVVLADADRIFVMQSDGKSASVAKNGTVEECKANIITLLEGGADAFRQRKERYGY